MLKRFQIAALGIGLFAFSPLVHADMVYYLTTDGCSSSCGTAPYGTIDLTQTNANTVTVEFTLAKGVNFANTGAGAALAFQINGPTPVITILGASKPAAGDYTPSYTGVKASAFGNFDLAIFCTGCANGGKPSNPGGPIDFTVTRNTGLSVSDFVSSLDKKGNPTGYYFASDIMGTTGGTGNVAALAGVTATPEPGYQVAMLGMIGAVVWLGRRRIRRTA